MNKDQAPPKLLRVSEVAEQPPSIANPGTGDDLTEQEATEQAGSPSTDLVG